MGIKELLAMIAYYLYSNSMLSWDIDVDAKFGLKSSTYDNLRDRITTVAVDLDFLKDYDDKTVYFIDKYQAIDGSNTVDYGYVNSLSMAEQGIDRDLVINLSNGESIEVSNTIICSSVKDIKSVLSNIDKSTIDVILDVNNGFYIIVKK